MRLLPSLQVAFGVAFAIVLAATPCVAMISVGHLTKDAAKEKYGITMHARQNGDAGVLVWLEFKKRGWLESFTYAELRMVDADGKHVVSAKLQPGPIRHAQKDDITTVAFSADVEHL